MAPRGKRWEGGGGSSHGRRGPFIQKHLQSPVEHYKTQGGDAAEQLEQQALAKALLKASRCSRPVAEDSTSTPSDEEKQQRSDTWQREQRLEGKNKNRPEATFLSSDMEFASMLQMALGLSIATRCFAQIDTVPEVVPETSNDGPTYQFKYHVNDLMTMDYKTHEEYGENGSVRGSYTVREPNGNLRVVSYTAGDSGGFQAMVQVKPKAPAEQESNQPFALSKNDTDAPLKIQLDSGRRIYKTNQQEQRENLSIHQDKTNFQPTAYQVPPDIRHYVTQHTKHINANTHVNTSNKRTTSLSQNSKPENNTELQFALKEKEKGKLNSPLKSKKQVPKFTAMQNLEAAQLPHQVSPVQRKPHPAAILEARKSHNKPGLNISKLCNIDL